MNFYFCRIFSFAIFLEERKNDTGAPGGVDIDRSLTGR